MFAIFLGRETNQVWVANWTVPPDGTPLTDLKKIAGREVGRLYFHCKVSLLEDARNIFCNISSKLCVLFPKFDNFGSKVVGIVDAQFLGILTCP